MRYLRIKNWDKYQIQSKKRLPWIKLMTELLSSTVQIEYANLPDVAKAHLHHIWLMAAVFGGRIPEDWLTQARLNIKSRLSLDLLIDSGYVFFETENESENGFENDFSLDSLTQARDARSEISNHLDISASTGVDFLQETAFDQIWPDYPRRIGRKEAYRYFCATVKTAADFAAIRVALEHYKAEVKDREQKYIQHGKTWFNEWRDWVEAPSRPARPVAAPEAQSRMDALIDRVRAFMGSDDDFMREFGFSKDEWGSYMEHYRKYGESEPIERWLRAQRTQKESSTTSAQSVST